jgi:hypothetical protein
MRPSNATRLARATPAILAGLALLAASTAAQDSPPQNDPAQIESQAPALPGSGASIEAFRLVDSWVRAGFAVPSESQPTDPPGTTAACVTIRLSGKVLGRSTESSSSGDAVWRAARGAALQAIESAPTQRDATRDEQLRDIAKRATLDIQFAGRLTPLMGDTFAEAAVQLNPGVDGVAMRVGDSLALVFPGTMLSTNSTVAEAISACAGQLELPPVELASLRKDHNAIIYSFRVQQLAQPLAGREPVFLFRGGRVITPTEVSLAQITAFAHGLAHRMNALRFPGDRPLGLLGDYQPWNGKHDPVVAPARDQALAMYALARYATSPAIDAANRARAARTYWMTFADFIKVDPSETNPLEDPVAAAFITVAMRAAPERPPGMPRPPTNVNDPTVAALLAVRSAFDPEKGWQDSLRPSERAAIAFALADASRSKPDDAKLRDRATAAVRSLFREATPGTLVAYMPWLLNAELALAGDSDVPSLPALLELRELVWRHQLTLADAGPDNPDLVGGIVFTSGRNPLPTAQLTRPMVALSRMTFDPRFTPRDQVPSELARLMSSLRFLRQLAVDDDLLHMMQDEQVSRWGVRNSPWDQNLTLDASAMALLTLVEVLDGAARKR